MTQYIVTGMTCAACQAHVEKAVSALPDVSSVAVSLLTNSMSVEGTASSEEVIRAVEGAGYGAEVKGAETTRASASERLAAEEDALKDRETPRLKRRLIRSVIWLVILMYVTMGHNMLHLPVPGFLEHNHLGLALIQMLIALIVMYINRDFFTSGFRSLFRLSPNMDALVALGSSVSFLWSAYVFLKMTVMITRGVPNADLMEIYHSELYFEAAAMIPALITVGKTLESLSKGRTTDALKNLLRMAPKTATVERDGAAVEVGIDDVRLGDVFLVKPGDSIPVDGEIIEGSTAVDESALTGESIPVDKAEGDRVSAATINQSGFIRARATRVGEDTTFSQIIKMVSDAAATKAPIARIADRVSAVFVPAVIGIAVLVFIGWLIAGRDLVYALERAISVLVVSCPCALGLATPVAIMVGNGMGARNGILFKTSAAVEAAGRTQIVALDKTGTITAGKPEVTDVIPAPGVTEKELLSAAYSLEQYSEHPLARAVTAYGDGLGLEASPVSDFAALAGNGLVGTVNGSVMHGGSGSFISGLASVGEELAARSAELAGQGKTPLYFERDGSLLGIIAVADVIKPDSEQAVIELRNMGVEVVMLTGDNERTANAIGAQAGVDRVIAGVLPEGKEAVIRSLQERGRVAMVGDGINDAPALTRADIGIAIGAGTDVAIDSADVVLMNSKLTDVSGAVRLSRATLRNIHQNPFWAFAYNVILIPMAAGLIPGIRMNPMFGAAAMAISSFTVCMNALRLNLFRVHDASRDRRMRRQALPESAATPAPAGEPSEAAADKSDNVSAAGNAVILVGGMTCGMCEKHVKEALEKLPGIVSASADHTTGRVSVTYTDLPAEDLIRDAVEREDYEYAGMEPPSAEAGAPRSAVLLVEGMMCEMCEKHVKEALEALDGIVSASADHASGRVSVGYTALPDEADIRAALEAADYTYAGIEASEADPLPATKTIRISGMSCSHCENAVKKALEAVEGVVSADVSHEEGTAEITLSGDVPGSVLKAAVEDEGYTVTEIV